MVDGPVTPLRFRHGDTSLVRCRVPRRCVTRILTLATVASPDQDGRTKSTPVVGDSDARIGANSLLDHRLGGGDFGLARQGFQSGSDNS